MPRKRRSRIYWRSGRAWGDFRDYADVGGGLEGLTAPGEAKMWQDRGLDVIASTPEAFAAHIDKEQKKWGKVIKERGIKAE